MTFAEAIEILKQLEYYARPFDNSIESVKKSLQIHEALNMAINNLEQEKRLLDAWHKTTDKIGKIITKNISQEVIDNWSACVDVISKCESVKSKYYIHRFKGVSKNEQFTKQH